MKQCCVRRMLYEGVVAYPSERITRAFHCSNSRVRAGDRMVHKVDNDVVLGRGMLQVRRQLVARDGRYTKTDWNRSDGLRQLPRRQHGVVNVDQIVRQRRCPIGTTSTAQRRSTFDKIKPTRLRRPRGPPMEENRHGGTWRAIVPLCENEFRNGRGGGVFSGWSVG
jgi:hypothetical protein